jgi:hypothetical protein
MPGNDDLTLPKGTLKVHPHPILPRFFLWDVIAKHDAHVQRLHFEKHVLGTSRPRHGSVYGAAVEELLLEELPWRKEAYGLLSAKASFTQTHSLGRKRLGT